MIHSFADAGHRIHLTTIALAVALVAVIAMALAPAAQASNQRAVVKVQTVKVGAPGNPSVAVVPFTDAIYQSCADAPASSKSCLSVGAVKDPYSIGQLEITVDQWVRFLNTVDPDGTDQHDLYDGSESSSAWPRYGQINRSSKAKDGKHYSVASAEWADKPYGFSNFLRAARFVNSMYNGDLLAKNKATADGFKVTTYKVRLSAKSGRGMYDLKNSRRSGATRADDTGFVVPSQDEWIKSAYYDPAGGGTFSYWKYPTNAGVFGDGTATAPSQTTLDPSTGDVTNAATQPLATYHASGTAPPSWCPATVQPASDCTSVNPFGIDATTYGEIYQASVGTVGQARTLGPWGTLDQGGNVVEWTDTITPPPAGNGEGRVWRRLHGGIANAPVYQLWLSAVGLNPENNQLFMRTYPWLGFRVGVVGNLKVLNKSS